MSVPAEVQLYIIHQRRNGLRYVGSVHQKTVFQRTKKSLSSFYKRSLSVYFKYPEDIRRVFYTTNIIKFVHRQFRSLTKNKGSFPNDNSLLQLLFIGI